MKYWIGAIAAIGATRFALTMSGVPNDITKFASMTVIIFAGTIYYALKAPNRKQRLKAAYLLILPYMVVEVAVLGYAWASGRETIFHAPEYSFDMPIHLHTIGHLIGGLTWEPLFLFLLMEIVYGASRVLKRKNER